MFFLCPRLAGFFVVGWKQKFYTTLASGRRHETPPPAALRAPSASRRCGRGRRCSVARPPVLQSAVRMSVSVSNLAAQRARRGTLGTGFWPRFVCPALLTCRFDEQFVLGFRTPTSPHTFPNPFPCVLCGPAAFRHSLRSVWQRDAAKLQQLTTSTVVPSAGHLRVVFLYPPPSFTLRPSRVDSRPRGCTAKLRAVAMPWEHFSAAWGQSVRRRLPGVFVSTLHTGRGGAKRFPFH